MQRVLGWMGIGVLGLVGCSFNEIPKSPRTLVTYTAEDCDNLRDDDGDDALDCEDADCANLYPCNGVEYDCSNLLDEDRDGLMDCDDPDCDPEAETPSLNKDQCAGACVDQNLGERIGAIVSTGLNADKGDDNDNSCGGRGAEDVGLLWRAPLDGVYTFISQGTDYDHVLSLQERDCDGATLVCEEGAANAGTMVRQEFVTGDQAVIVVDGASEEDFGSFRLAIFVDGCPDRDVGAEEGDALAYGNSTLNLPTLDEPASCGDGVETPDVIIKWTAPYGGRFTVDTFGSNYDTVVSVLAPDNPEVCGGEEIACNDNIDAFNFYSAAEIGVDAGDVLYIAIGGIGGATGDWVLNIYG